MKTCETIMLVGNGGGGNENPANNSNLTNEKMDTINEINKNGEDKKEKRVRRYDDNNVGPFVVCIRAMKKPLPAMSLIRVLHKTYKSTLNTRQINEFKINVVFSPINDEAQNVLIARNEANHFANTDWQDKDYLHIYIPEKLVEVIGCIVWSADEPVEDIVTYGQGKFRNTTLKDVKIVNATRFEKLIDEAGNEQRREPTNTVRVTFEGLLLPSYVNVDGLLISVREFKRKQMFCEACLKYNHTISHCNNKPYKPEQNEKKCVHCKTDDHQTGDKGCPKRKNLEIRDKKTMRTSQKQTYAQMLQSLDPSATLNNDAMSSHFPLNLGTRIERKRHHQQLQTQGTSKSSTKKQRLKSAFDDIESWEEEDEVENVPPGFRKNCAPEEENDFIKAVKDFIVDLELPSFITQLIIKITVPFFDKLINKFTSSFMAKILQVNQNE